ncbi:hypothetical protein jhhlp_000883 [Lomentospora prolificans]|uniref:DUF7582 domain-containing protein n=1 Tax=Lomentospora prolificans TaxID=41688 RepID=A0A2N3NJQ2_9PEZI|nr:hypothetical protein jhhlp_000883 [Lomentospora prolificans]
MALSKDCISMPLEAGTSLLDIHHIPTRVNEALEYAARRFSRKGMQIALVAVCREYHTPSILPVCESPIFSSPVSPGPTPTPSRMGFAASLKQRLTRSNTHPVLSLNSSINDLDLRSATASPTWSVSSETTAYSSASSKPSWPCTPATPATPMSVPPMTPASTISSIATDSSPLSPIPCGIRLVHGDVLCPKDEQTVRQVLEKAARKYKIGSQWLPTVAYPATYGLTDGIIRRSLRQDETLFSSHGLTVYSLDRLYTFKSALSSYSRTNCPLRLEDAVDELRRLFLAGGGRKVPKADILRSYDWLNVSDAALADVDRMYRRAYGAPGGTGAIDGMTEIKFELEELMTSSIDEIRLEIEEAIDDIILIQHDGEISPADEEWPLPSQPVIILERPTPILSTPIGWKAPAELKAPVPTLRLQTTFDAPAKTSGDIPEEKPEEDEDLTARPERATLRPIWPTLGPGASIDEILRSPGVRTSRSSDISRLGPMTPNGYDDISPTTRGEWGFLFSDASFRIKTAAVETW